MQQNSSPIDIVLVADNPAKTALLHDFMNNNGNCGQFQCLPHRKKTLASLQRKGPRSTSTTPDLILFDFSEPGRRVFSLLEQLVFGATPCVAPVVLLTSPVSEQLLENGAVNCGEAIMFAPKTLTDFVRKMREHRRELFLRSVSTISALGPILVRMPETFATRADGHARLTA